MKELSANSSSTLHRNEYQYNGKMFQDELGLDWYDYGFRYYNPQIARWHVIDPLAEKYLSHSPYNYTLNNPIGNIDLFGLDVKNRHEEEREEKKKIRDETHDKRNNYTGKKNTLKYWKLNYKANKAERRFKRIDRKYEHTNRAINDLKKYNEPLFNKLDNLQDPGGTEVDVYVESVDNLNTNSMGPNPDFPIAQTASGLSYMKPKNTVQMYSEDGSMTEYYSVQSQHGDNTVSILLNSNLKDPGLILSHEGGHTVYNVAFLKAYISWLKGKSSGQGGHGIGNQSGINADTEEAIYKRNKNNNP